MRKQIIDEIRAHVFLAHNDPASDVRGFIYFCGHRLFSLLLTYKTSKILLYDLPNLGPYDLVLP